MKLFALLPMLFLISCQDGGLGSRSLVNDSAVEPAANTNPPNVVPPPVTPAKNLLHSRCQSSTRCFYSRMPAYKQDDSALENYVGSKIGQPGYHDRGLCAPTAAAIMLRAVLDERDSRTKLNNTFLQSVPSRPWYESVYQIGFDASTDFRNGGTFSYLIYETIQKYFEKTVSHKGLYMRVDGTGAMRANFSNQDVINLVKAKKPALYLVIDSLEKKQVGGRVWYEPSRQQHAVVIKGFDGDRLHIQDPWGMDHFTRLQHQNIALSQYAYPSPNSVFTDFTPGANNFIGSYGVTMKIGLIEVFAVSLD